MFTCILSKMVAMTQSCNFIVGSDSLEGKLVKAGIMGPHTTLTSKIFKLNVHLGDMQVLLSTNFPIKTCLS